VEAHRVLKRLTDGGYVVSLTRDLVLISVSSMVLLEELGKLKKIQ
jgi:hypothetical protein